MWPPKHAESFSLHAKNNDFDGTTFHHVVPGYLTQGGDPNSRDDGPYNDG